MTTKELIEILKLCPASMKVKYFDNFDGDEGYREITRVKITKDYSRPVEKQEEFIELEGEY